MNTEIFKSILNSKLGILFSSVYNELFKTELIKLNPVAELDVDLCGKEDCDKARKIVIDEMHSSKKENYYTCCPRLREAEQKITENHNKMICDTLSRINLNKEQISRTLLGIEDFSEIISVKGDGSDVHHHGCLTMVMETPKGSFVYKPHSCKTDVVVYEIVQNYFSDLIRVPKALDFGNYGFCEYIKNSPAGTKEEAAEFYFHFGALTALVCAFGAMDLHSENFLADGVYPVPIDLEIFFSPQVKMFYNEGKTVPHEDDYKMSVALSGLLSKVINHADFSPLTSITENNLCAPVIEGQKQTVLHYQKEFFDGFELCYERCLRYKGKLIESIEKISNLNCRFLVRNTDFYHLLLIRFNSPEFETEECAEKYLKEKLSKAFDKLPGQELAAIAEAEFKSIKEGDIPFFYSVASSKDLYSDGKIIVKDYFQMSAIENVVFRINRLSRSDKEFEQNILRSSFAYAIIPNDTHSFIEEIEDFVPLSGDRAVSVAEKTGKEIYDSAFPFFCGRKGFVGHYNRMNLLSPIGPQFATGMPGIVTFLAALSKQNKEFESRAGELGNIANDYLELLLSTMERKDAVQNEFVSPGLAEGLAGFINALSITEGFMPTLFPTDSLNRLLDLLDKTNISECESCDVYAGLSGLIISLYKISDRYDVKKHIACAAKRLLELQTFQENGLRLWETINNKHVISGYGHGMAGIGLALLYAYDITGDERYFQAAESAYFYEHRIFSERIGTWPDLRNSFYADSSLNGICSGAPGVGLCMLIGEKFDMPYAKVDKERALKHVLSQKLNYKDNLCCGNLSSAEMLISFGYMDEAGDLLSKIIKRAQMNGGYTFIPNLYRPF